MAEVGDTAEEDQVYRLTYEGSVADEHGYAVMGGSAEQVSIYLKEHYTEGLDLDDALRLAVEALGHDGTQTRHVTGDRLEVAVLDRTRRNPRKFRRLVGDHLTALFGTGEDEDEPEAPADIPPTVDGDETPPPSAAPAGKAIAEESPPVDDTPAEDPSDDIGDLPDDPDTPPRP